MSRALFKGANCKGGRWSDAVRYIAADESSKTEPSTIAKRPSPTAAFGFIYLRANDSESTKSKRTLQDGRICGGENVVCQV